MENIFCIYFTLSCDLSGSKREPNNIWIRWKWLPTLPPFFIASVVMWSEARKEANEWFESLTSRQ